MRNHPQKKNYVLVRTGMLKQLGTSRYKKVVEKRSATLRKSQTQISEQMRKTVSFSSFVRVVLSCPRTFLVTGHWTAWEQSVPDELFKLTVRTRRDPCHETHCPRTDGRLEPSVIIR